MLGLFTDRLLLHIDDIDNQHKTIFDLLEKFNKVCTGRTDKNEMVDLYNEFKKHTELHFYEEEQYMIKYDYSEYYNHKREHDMFLRKIYILDSMINNDNISFSKVLEINYFFAEGLLTHFCNADSKLVEFLNDKLI